MIKKLLSLVFVAGVLASVAPQAMAQSADIDPSGTSGVCLRLDRDLRYGWRDLDSNTEVFRLQDFLSANGYLGTGTQSTGFFGSLTFSAVQKFQSANGISPTGYVGPITRAKIVEITCSSTYAPSQSAFAGTVTTNISNGCLPGYLFSGTTGLSCKTVATLPAGCLPGYLFSGTTGQRCDGSSVTPLPAPSPVPAPYIKVIYPNGGETFDPDSRVVFKWESYGVDRVEIYLASPNNSVFCRLASNTTGYNNTYSVQLNSDTCSGKTLSGSYKANILAYPYPDNGNYKDMSDGYFYVQPSQPSITITSPNGGENWQHGTTHTIRWDYSGPAKTLEILLYVESTATSETQRIATVSAGAERYSWTISTPYIDKSNMRIGLRDSSYPYAILDESSRFTISKDELSISYAQGLAAERNEIYAEEKNTVYGEDFNYDDIYVRVVGNGYDVRIPTYNTSSGSADFRGPNIPGGYYDLYIERGSLESNRIEVHLIQVP